MSVVRWSIWRVRLASALVALIVVGLAFAVVITARYASRSNAPKVNLYFRDGDPLPVAFPLIHTETTPLQLDRDPHGAEPFGEVGVEWHPKTGPFVDVRARPLERSPIKGAPSLWVQYRVRPQFQREFQSSLEEAFAGQAKEKGSQHGEEIWPDVRGSRLTIESGLYTVFPQDGDNVVLSRFFKAVEESVIGIFAFSLVYWIVSVGLTRRFGLD